MLRLEFPNETHKEMYEDMKNEWEKEPDFADTSPGALFHGDTFEKFLEITRKYQEGNTDKTPATTLFAIVDDKIIGGINIRHNIEAYNLKEYSGHIGYGIRPSERKKGYATEMLKLGIMEARKLGIESILICCYDNNIASAKVIEKNGGIFERYTEKEGKKLKRYWITLN